MCRDRVGHGLLDEGLVGDVAAVVGAAAGFARKIGLVLEIDQTDVGTLVDQIPRDLQTHAAAGAGDQRNLALEAHP